MTIVNVIAIDGPTASGKGTVAHKVADAVGFHLLDSGALYRLVALASDRAGIDLADVDALARIASRLDVKFGPDRVWLQGEEVSLAIRAEAIGNRASAIAVHQPVRDALTQLQRSFRKLPGLVADGRDMGTVVFPDAVLKIFLDASPEARAERRWLQLSQAGVNARLIDLCTEVRARDERDRKRTVAPLAPATDAIVVDSTEMKPGEVLAEVGRLLQQRGISP